MTRLSLALFALAVAGCAPVEDGADGNWTRPPTMCGSRQLDRFVGKKRTDAISAEVARISEAKSIRWIKPGTAVTMDYRPERLNVDLDDKGVITGFHCG